MLDRVIGAFTVLVATLVPLEYLKFATVPEVQFIVGTIIVLYILFGDAAAGLLFGIAVLIIYFRAYSGKIGITWDSLFFSPKKSYTSSMVTDYITPEHLERAQTNVFNEDDYRQEMKGIEGVYGEAVYGAQGLADDLLPGYTPAFENI